MADLFFPALAGVAAIPYFCRVMWGLYVHVPFCKSRCVYCGFYSTVGGPVAHRRYVDALCAELHGRRHEVGREAPETVYVGGGTPSLLAAEELERLFREIHALCGWSPTAEITLEANPDDVDARFVATVTRAGVNRVSLGVQTFNDRFLHLLRRRHDARQARLAVEFLSAGGVENVSIDLIYGIPGQTLEEWKSDLDAAFALPVAHLSAYSLMFEEGTPLNRMRERGKVAEADEELSRSMYELLMERCRAEGMVHYEISNFARPGRESRHNSSYWTGVPYVGLGPAAHSFDGRNRRFNLPDLAAYLASPGCPPHEREMLTDLERADEEVMVALRTSRGLSLDAFEAAHGKDARMLLLREAAPHLKRGRLELKEGRLFLTCEGLFVSDLVMSDLMLV